MKTLCLMIVVAMFLSTGNWVRGQCMAPDCYKFLGYEVICDDGGLPFHDCIPAGPCQDFKTAGPEYGQRWDATAWLLFGDETGYTEVSTSSAICSYWGQCLWVLVDPNDENGPQTCVREPFMNWNFMPRYRNCLDTDLPCCLD